MVKEIEITTIADSIQFTSVFFDTQFLLDYFSNVAIKLKVPPENLNFKYENTKLDNQDLKKIGSIFVTDSFPVVKVSQFNPLKQFKITIKGFETAIALYVTLQKFFYSTRGINFKLSLGFKSVEVLLTEKVYF